ncbi:MAG TPA: amidohydrolase family protein [Planctomycetota bacterium]
MSTFSPIVAAALLPLFAASLASQDLLPKGAPQRGPIVLQNAVLHTITGGVLEGGTLWFDGGVIRGVLPKGEQPALPPGSSPRVIDLQGKHVFPGLIAGASSLGLVELGMVRQSVDTDELGELSPEALAMVAVNPDSAHLPVTRCNGVLATIVFPIGGLLPGRASAFHLDGWTNADLTVRADVGPVVAWPAQPGGIERGRRGPRPGSPQPAEAADATKKARQRIDDAFVAARAWLTARTAEPALPVDIRHEALAPALRREVPVFVLADELEQIESAVAWCQERALRCVIVGGRDAAACATVLKAASVPVVVTGVHKLPRREDSAYDEPFTLPKRLLDLGVPFCIASGGEAANERNLPYHAATAVAFGLDRERALAAITHDAATIFGVADRLGSLGAGKDATLFVADGHPFALTTKIELAFVQGRTVDLRNKHTELAQKYRERYRQLEGK